MPEMVLPGVYIEVRPEALIVPGAISAGNIGIVGTAATGEDLEVVRLSSFPDAKDIFGEADAFDPTNEGNELTLTRALEIAYSNGATTVFAVKVPSVSDADYKNGLDQLLNENVQIVVAAGKAASDTGGGIGNELNAHVEDASDDGTQRERIAIVGNKLGDGVDEIKANISTSVNDNGRMIFVAPGIKVFDVASSEDVILPGSYTAAAVAGRLSSLDPHVSPTNKILPIAGLETKFNAADREELINAGVLALEERQGFRIVKGITTSTNTAWHQVTTRRIVDFAKRGVRSASLPYIGLLNNDRVRKALKGSINGFLAGMVDAEMLISYELDVTATREEEIRGIAKVTLTLRPTFSIDFIRVVMFLG